MTRSGWPLLRVTEEVEDALRTGRPVVALESTLLTHGVPRDRSASVARLLEEEVRREGAVPATIAILDGRFFVGLSESDLERLLQGSARKASLRDLAVAVAQRGLWSTTVAATMSVAHRAGIRLFATGGIGGVHRGADQTYDESADLTALSRIPVTVVSSGVKAVLDLPRTAERLETLGVPVVGFQCDELPAFYHAQSGIPLQARVESPGEVARLMSVQLDELGGGLLVVQPPPLDYNADRLEALIETALVSAEREGVRGTRVTPYLLSALRAASAGEVLEINIALVRKNAALAAKVAVAERSEESNRRSPT